MNRPDPELLEIFTAEQAEHVQRMRSVIETLSAPAPDSALEGLMRLAHTLKGAARAAGFEPTEILTHALEGAFASIRSSRVSFSPNVRALLLRALDTAEDILAAVLANRRVPETEGLLREIAEVAGTEPILVAQATAPGPAAEPDSGPASAAGFVRIHAGYLDELMSASSELVAAAAAAESETASREQILRVEATLREWSRLRQEAAPYLRSRQQDPALAPIRECIQGADRSLQLLLAEVRADATSRQRREWELRRLTDRLDETAFRVRMVSADTIFGAFGPMLRSLAQEHRKQIEFHAEGLELPADRLVLQSLKDPVMHLLRNALSHGIEPKAERTRAGKSPAGTIRLALRAQGDRLHVTVEDDGRGLDRHALMDQAVRQAILPEGDAPLSDEALTDLIFRPGFSTSSEVTTLAGRGMGLAIARHEVRRLHGEIRVHSQRGKGAAITLTVPLSISSQQLLLVQASGNTYGIPTSFTQQLLQVQPQDIRTLDGKPAVAINGNPVGLVRLTDLLGLSKDADAVNEATLPAVVATAGGRTAAIVVDRLIDVRDAVIRPIGLPPELAGWSAGAVPLPDGTVAVVLNMTDVLGRFREVRERAAVFTPAVAEERISRILVVDDSITTRSLEKSLLEAHGYAVQVAVDGVEALEKLRAEIFDVVITDLMMPRMDGFQLLEQIRRDPSLTRIPVIVVSSMESREDQERGLALGADAYIVKQKFDQRELLETVRQIL